MPHIDKSLMGADGYGPNDHSFHDNMGISLQKASVHIGTGISLVSITDDKSIPIMLAAGLPFYTGGESAAPTTP